MDEPSWNDMAASWDEREDVRDYAQQAFSTLQPYAATLLVPGQRVMDFGAGTGALCEHLVRTGCEVVAVDVAEKMLAVLDSKRLPRVQTLCADLTEVAVDGHPAFQKPFGLITASSACAFVADYAACLRVLAQLLAPGGRFVQWDWELEDATQAQGPGFTQLQIREAYRAAGLTPLHVNTAFVMAAERESFPVVMGVATRT